MGKCLLFLSNCAFPLAGIGVLLGFLFSPRRSLLKHLKQECRERFALQKEEDFKQNALWIHCASVGEVLSVKELISRLKRFYNKDVIVTTSTAAGKEAALKNPQISQVFLVPLDFYPNAARFVRRLKPHRFFIIERELWPNLICAATDQGVPCLLINSRMSEKSARAYRVIRPLFSYVFSKISIAALQTQEDAARYQSLGLAQDKIGVYGNIKYDTLSDHPPRLKEAQTLIDTMGFTNSPILVCGSTHPLEEEMIFAAVPKLAKEGIKIIFAPRHLERMAEIETRLKASAIRYALADGPAKPDTRLLCINTMGMLQSLYACGDLAFVGGSVVPRGAHNLLEPAILGKTVLFGKYFYNTPQPAQELLRQGGGMLVDEASFAPTVLRLFQDKPLLQNMAAMARSTALSFKGATDKIMERINTYERK